MPPSLCIHLHSSTISFEYTTLLYSSLLQLCTRLKFGFQSSAGLESISPWEFRRPSGIFVWPPGDVGEPEEVADAVSWA